MIVEGNNFIGDNETADAHFPAGLLVGTVAAPLDPELGPLFAEIGGTSFLPPLAGSPVLDAGDDTVLPADVVDLDGDLDVSEIYPSDQSGQDRTSGPAADLGAIEDQTANIALALAKKNAAIARQAVIQQTLRTLASSRKRPEKPKGKTREPKRNDSGKRSGS